MRFPKRLVAAVAIGSLVLSILTLAVISGAPDAAANPGTPNTCTNIGSYKWSTEWDMADARTTFCRGTWIVDPGRGHFLTRDQLLAHAGLYAHEGFSTQFLWYAPQATVSVPATSLQRWSDCTAYSYLDRTNHACPFDMVDNTGNVIASDFTDGVNLTTLDYHGNWISLVCGNYDVPHGAVPEPVPMIHGVKFDDANRDGVQDNGEGGVGGVTFTLTRISSQVGQATGQVAQTTSASDGTFSFPLDNNEGPGTYRVQEQTPAGWQNTTPAAQDVVVGAGVGDASYHVSFGDIQETPLHATAVGFSAVEGAPFSGPVATFSDADSLDSADAPTADSATIDWGDGTTTSGTITSAGGGTYTVSGAHTYADESSPTVTVHITDPDDPGNPATTSATAVVGDAQLHATGVADFVSPNPVSQMLATFTDANPGATVSDFTSGGGSTTIDWGDGTSSTGTVTQTGPGQFSVGGTHTYAALGPYAITVHVVDDGGSVATATTHVIVFAYATGGAFVVGQISGVGTAVTFWSDQWTKDNVTSGSARTFKGFETSTDRPSCPGTWTSRTGDSVRPPATIPSYTAVVVTSTVGQSGPAVSGDIQKVVIVRTNPGYGPNPGHAGTGTAVATLCG